VENIQIATIIVEENVSGARSKELELIRGVGAVVRVVVVRDRGHATTDRIDDLNIFVSVPSNNGTLSFVVGEGSIDSNGHFSLGDVVL
jgi:hypothetical protein